MMNIVCVYGEVESEEHVLLYCNLYMDVRRRWKEILASVNVDVYNAIKGYEAKNDCIERTTIIMISGRLDDCQVNWTDWCDCLL